MINVKLKEVDLKYATQGKTWVSFVLDNKDVEKIEKLEYGKCVLIEIDRE